LNLDGNTSNGDYVLTTPNNGVAPFDFSIVDLPNVDANNAGTVILNSAAPMPADGFGNIMETDVVRPTLP
jgi:hypothetical protein